MSKNFGKYGENKIQYKYKVYGINITSDFEMKELVPSDGPTDVEVLVGQVPSEIEDLNINSDEFQSSRKELKYTIPEVASYYISGGKKIIVEPMEGARPATVKLFLLGTTFGILLHQRGILPIHGSAAVVAGKGAIFTGESGAGKSTLCSALRERGYQFLTDDVAALKFEDMGNILVQPGYPQQKLWKDSAQKLGIEVKELSKVREELDKYFLSDTRGFLYNPVRLTSIFELIPHDCEEVIIDEVKGVQKLSIIMNNTYRVQLLDILGLSGKHFQMCSHVAKEVRVFKIFRPKEGFTTTRQIELIERVLA